MKNRIIIGVIIGLIAGLMLGRSCRLQPEPATGETSVRSPAKAEIWTCSMHPQIRQPKPGQCPICGMDLIPAAGEDTGVEDGARVLVLSESARALAEVETAPVERRFAEVEIRMTGKVQLDETRLAYITARVPGRIDRLYANVTGTPVKQGEHLADLYSPELLSAQQELMQAARAGGQSGDNPSASALVKGAREKLRLWGLTPGQIGDIEHSEKIQEHLTFYAPIGGIVLEKEAIEGMYVEPGMRLFTVADLGSVWVGLDAYESDLAWIRYGQQVDFQVEAYPGESFHGTISFIDPMLDPMTRTVRVRVNAANTDSRLKPEMLVHALLKAGVSEDGTAISPNLSGIWMCSMHPEVVQDGPGSCRVCQMPLVPAGQADHGKPAATPNAPLLIPASAPLVTGTRAVVYVAAPGIQGRYEGRDISLGPRAGNYYVVRSGLKEGELVVTRGNFKIDSSLQIQGKTSMMSGGLPDGDQYGTAHSESPAIAAPVAIPEALRAQLAAFIDAISDTGAGLAADDLDRGKDAAGKAAKALKNVDMGLVPRAAHEAWMRATTPLSAALADLAVAKGIETARTVLSNLDEPLRAMIRAIGADNMAPVYVIHCPMAFDGKGASWVQRTSEVHNPYFGKSMLTCGEVVVQSETGRDVSAGGHQHE